MRNLLLIFAIAFIANVNRQELTDTLISAKTEIIILLDEHGYPPAERDKEYEDIFEQAESCKPTHKKKP